MAWVKHAAVLSDLGLWIEREGGYEVVNFQADHQCLRGAHPSRSWRQKIPADVRRSVIARDGGVCGLCGQPVPNEDVHIDHIYPQSLGGADELDNLQVTHSLCNMRKGNRV